MATGESGRERGGGRCRDRDGVGPKWGRGAGQGGSQQEARSTNGRGRLLSWLFMDLTGRGWVWLWAGDSV